MRRILMWGGLALVVAGLIVYSTWPRPREVEAGTVTHGTIEAFVTEEAETRLDDEYVVCMPVAGRLRRLDLKEDDAVDSGAVIAHVDTFERRERLKTLRARVSEIQARIVGVDEAKPKPDDIRAADLAVQEARIGLGAAGKARDVARINFEQEQRQFDRSKRLHADGTISDSEFDEAQRRFLTLKSLFDEADLKVGVAGKTLERAEVTLKRLRESVDDNEYLRAAFKAQIEQIEADVRIIEDELAKSEIRAPVAGPVLEIYQDGQQVLPAGARLLKVGDMNSIRIEADVLSEEIGRVRKDGPVEITGPAVGDDPITGTVDRIFPSGFKKVSSLGIEQQRVKVIIAFDNTRVRLRPGVRVDIRIITERRANVLLVPDRALFKASDAWHVFVVRDGRARLTPVTVGLRNDEFAEIAAGLAADETVILSPPAELNDGDRVALPPPDASRAADAPKPDPGPTATPANTSESPSKRGRPFG